ncbi:ribosome maturation factor RimP [Marinimicrobium sp. ABcell2]|uniref:ribosome maturation factor RimP n=1 Tax=Marinimicrobium sp. ABcell2 TaxID=3069751 RepID=UPI0027B025AA|nr:ribosome maturation factor RimP [Marinimicrobium sp. ABcell2]MDQ2076318.1 ribosome maturation factor RimP [Marinimicrobium sp. ABcell2]
MVSKQQKLQALVAPVVSALGCELWGLEYLTQGRQSTVRVYIEREGGVALEDCERASRQISSVFDVEDPISEHYTLEVSSPGMDRPLYTLEQFAQYVGEDLALKLRSAIDGRRKFKGTLKGVEGQNVLVVVDSEEFLLPFETIEKANIVPRF